MGGNYRLIRILRNISTTQYTSVVRREMSTTEDIVPITDPVQHSEGPFYDDRNAILYYVDTFTATAFRLHVQTTKRTSYKLEGHDSIGVIIPFGENQDEFVVGADKDIYRMLWRDCKNSQPMLEQLVTVEEDKPSNQFNDGKVDNMGRLWMGTLTRNKDLSVAPDGGSLYTFKNDDVRNYEKKIATTTISNGLAWSSDGKSFYFIDSAPRLVYGYKYDMETGQIDNRKVVLDMEDHPDLKGLPDGMTIDAQNNLWIALFGGHSVINVNPRTSAVIKVVEMPVTYITSACFGGPHMDILFVTSSRLHLNEEQLKKEPLAGSVFAISNLGVSGFRSNRFNVTNC